MKLVNLVFCSYILSVLLRSETPDISHKAMDTLQSEQAVSYGAYTTNWRCSVVSLGIEDMVLSTNLPEGAMVHLPHIPIFRLLSLAERGVGMRLANVWVTSLSIHHWTLRSVQLRESSRDWDSRTQVLKGRSLWLLCCQWKLMHLSLMQSQEKEWGGSSWSSSREEIKAVRGVFAACLEAPSPLKSGTSVICVYPSYGWPAARFEGCFVSVS